MDVAWLLSCGLLVTACGRIGFDPGEAREVAPAAPSCSGLAPICGPDAASACCASPIVPGGTFRRGYDVGSDARFADPSYPATVSELRLDAYEVTVGRFRAFVTAGAGTQANPPAAGAGARSLNGAPSQGGWDPAWNAALAVDTAALLGAVQCSQRATWTDTPGANEALAMNCVTWFEAFAFCVWDDGFLPTEAEWNYAAAGGSEQRAYPWSIPASSLAIDCSFANHAACTDPPTGVGRVGSKSPAGDGRWGHADLAGNVSEWMLDYHHDPYRNPCTDCANLTVSTYRVTRNGTWFDDVMWMRGAVRGGGPPDPRYNGLGFRCARPP